MEESSFVPHDRLIAAIVNELARSRVRHRALLGILERHQLLDIAEYVKEYSEEETHDFVPFVELLLLTPAQFSEKWPQWLEENSKRFGYEGSSRMRLSLESGEQAREPAEKRKGRPSSRKKD